jgi:hypothetical protein
MLRVLAMEWGGLRLPNDSSLRDWSFADDTTLYLAKIKCQLEKDKSCSQSFL